MTNVTHNSLLYVVTTVTSLLIMSERSHYFRNAYLKERGFSSTKSYADRLYKETSRTSLKYQHSKYNV